MTINLFPRELTRNELQAAAEKQGVMLPLPLLNLPAEKLPPVDEALLEQVADLMGMAAAQLHFELQKDAMSAPLLSLYVSHGRLMSMIYTLTGAMPCDVVNPQQIKRLLMSVCASMPLPSPEGDVHATLPAGMTVFELRAALTGGDASALDGVEAQGVDFAAACEALRGAAVTSCTMDSPVTGTTQGYFISDGQRVYSIFEQDDQLKLVIGSPYQFISYLNLKMIEALRDDMAAQG